MEQVREAIGRIGPEARFLLVANLPYNIATPIISNLLHESPPPDVMVVTIQKELGDRIVAEPGTKDYGALSVWVQSLCRVEIVRILPPTVFWPRPNVHSAIMRLDLVPEWREQFADLKYFHQTVRCLVLSPPQVLAQRRGQRHERTAEQAGGRRNLGEAWLRRDLASRAIDRQPDSRSRRSFASSGDR